MTGAGAPRVTIGLPVYNGGATLESAMRPLMAQTFPDFELLVSDNDSRDNTREVVERLAREDSRIRYVRQPVNLGANGNYSFVARNARGEFLKWASASDWCAPTFLERCVALLDAHPDGVLAAPRTRLFEGDLSHARDYPDDIAILDESPSARFTSLLSRLRLNNAFNGVIRLSALRATHLIPPYLEADLVLMGHLALLGKFLLVDERLYYRRMEVETSTTLQPPEERLKHHYPVIDRRTLFQEWKQQIGWVRAGLSAPMTIGERMRVLKILGRKLIWERAELYRDLLGVVRYALKSPR